MISSSNSGQEIFQLQDGKELKVNYFGDLVNHKAIVVIAPAMGIDAKFYTDIAKYLQENGFLSVTFNYTGIGESIVDMCKTNYGMLDWAHKNMDFLLVQIKKDFPNSKIAWLVHSAGGQMLGLCNHSQNIDKLISVSSGVGYWRLNSPELKKKIRFFWNFIVPVSVFFKGFFPGKKLKMVGDLPKKAIYDWRRACLKPNYLQDIFPEFAENYALLKAPIVAYYPEDDEMLSKESIEKLNSQYVNSNSKIIVLKPSDLNTKRIGHIGLFRKSYQDSFWKDYILPELNKI